MRVFLDTNVLVSAFATRGLCADVLRTVLANHELVVTEVVLEELTRVLADRIGVPEKGVSEIALFLRDFFVATEPLGDLDIVLRDPSDIPVVESAIAARADVVVSGDNDLLEADLPLPTMSPRAFWEMLRARDSGSSEVHEGR